MVAIEVALALLVVSDAGSASGLVWYGAGVALALLAFGLAAGWDTGVHGSLAILGLLLLARTDDRLVLAPAYGAALLAVSELADMCAQLQRVDHVDLAALRTRLLTIAVAAGLGACAAALVAAAVTAGAPRTVATSAAATVAVAVIYAGLAVMARRGRARFGHGDAVGVDEAVSRDEVGADGTF